MSTQEKQLDAEEAKRFAGLVSDFRKAEDKVMYTLRMGVPDQVMIETVTDYIDKAEKWSILGVELAERLFPSVEQADGPPAQ